MNIHAEKVVSIWAAVTYEGWNYRVEPNGTVLIWEVNDENVKGNWNWMEKSENGYDEIKQAGLVVLEET